MKFYVISGEASGDLHGSNLMLALKKYYPQAQFRCWGGEKMQDAGGVIVKHYRELAFMGFKEVIQNLPEILGNIRFCKKDILNFQPDALILVDYPGFNLRIAEWARKQGIKTIYYISPQVWAWKENRVPAMKKNIDLMLVILPFEKDYFKEKWNWDVHYVAHPLAETIGKFRPENTLFPGQNIVALLPGSRKQEIQKKLPVMLSLAEKFPAYHFVVAMAPGQDESFYSGFLEAYKNVDAISGHTYELVKSARAAIVTSGTATLETALLKTPEIVVYKTSKVSYQIARRLVKIKFISLVNLIMDRMIVKELIQDEMNPENLAKELDNLLHNETARQNMLKEFDALEEKLSGGGEASENAAKIIFDFLK